MKKNSYSHPIRILNENPKKNSSDNVMNSTLNLTKWQRNENLIFSWYEYYEVESRIWFQKMKKKKEIDFSFVIDPIRTIFLRLFLVQSKDSNVFVLFFLYEYQLR